jgi:hypothetical protein
VLLRWYEGWDRFTYVKQSKKKKDQSAPSKGALHWKSRPPVFIGVNRVKMLVLLLPHVRQREFLAWDGQLGSVILGASIDYRLYVMSHLLMSTIWDVIPYQHLSPDFWPLGFLTSHLVPVNIYLSSLVIFVGVLTTKVTESCWFKSCFMLGLTMRTAMLRLDPLLLCRWLTRNSPLNPKD